MAKSKSKNLINFVILSMTLLFSMPTFATEVDDSIANCLKAWGKHPFGNNPNYKTLATSVKVFGIGDDPTDSEVTNSPSLVLVNPGVNVMGGLTIKVHCKAHLASTTEAVTVLGSNSGQKSITVMGSTKIELVGCN